MPEPRSPERLALPSEPVVTLEAVTVAYGTSAALRDVTAGFPAGAVLGHGLHNVRERLRGYYGESAELQWECGQGGTRVWLRIPRAPVADLVARNSDARSDRG